MFNNVLIDCVHISVEAAVNKRVYPLANMPVHLLPLRWHKTIWTRTRERNKKAMHQYLCSSDQCVSNTEPKASKVCSEKSYNYYLIFIRSERKKFAQRWWATVKRKKRGGVGAFPHLIPKPSNLNSKSSRVGRIDDREFVTLTHCNKIPAPQDASFRGDTTYMLPINCAAKYTAQSSAYYSLLKLPFPVSVSNAYPYVCYKLCTDPF